MCRTIMRGLSGVCRTTRSAPASGSPAVRSWCTIRNTRPQTTGALEPIVTACT